MVIVAVLGCFLDGYILFSIFQIFYNITYSNGK